VFSAVWDQVVELGVGTVEGVVWLEDVVIQPHNSVSVEQFTVQVICNSTSILYFSYHVLHSFELIRDVLGSAEGHVFINIQERCFQVCVVEFIRNTEP